VSNQTIWQAVLGEMEVTTSKANFETWLRNTKLDSLSDTTATISVPNVFIRGWVESHYKDLFLSSFQKHVATIADIQFQIQGSPQTAEPSIYIQPESESATPQNPITVAETSVADAAVTEASSTIIDSRTFDTFVEGNNNRLASTVSRAVAKSPGTLYNPLFIYGGVGLGKTHLMHAIANEVTQQGRKKRVLYVSCEKFTNDYIASISSKKTDQFKQTYRTLDLLLVDDIQFIANKEGSQEEFFNTFNTLHQSNRQIVIAADRVPKAIPGLEERLSSRFGWGMIVDIQPPNLETRMAILKSKCLEKGVNCPEEALEYIAQQVQSNIRELEGALNRVVIYCQMSHIPFSLEATRSALSGLIVPAHRKTHSVDTILSLIAEHFGMGVADLIGKKRNKELVYPRHITMFLLREEMNMSFPEIGRELGGKDHTTVMHGYNKITKELTTIPKISQDISHIKHRLATM
jgi:chromosomal replication initiator protein